jgi:NAD(P)-dependent dehydrogenase (short-subunit alcohol dehydrogenase family)
VGCDVCLSPRPGRAISSLRAGRRVRRPLSGIFGKGAGLDPARADQDAEQLEPVFRARLEAYQPIGRAGAPADVAAAALWLASDASSFVTGQDLAADGGILAGRPPGASAADFTAIA